jgi:hypothetical protein
MKLTRWIPKGSRKVEVKHLPGTVAYLYTAQDARQPYRVLTYEGKGSKATWHQGFTNEAARTKAVTIWVNDCISQHERTIKHRAEMQAKKQQDAPQIYLPGCIVDYAWGYEQTNIDFYIITARKGDMVTLQEIAKEHVEDTGWLQGKVMPVPDKPIGEPIKRKVHKYEGKETGIAIRSYGWASLWNGKPVGYTSYA